MFQKPGGDFQIVNIQKRGKPICFKEVCLEKLWPDGQTLSKEKINYLKDLLKFIPRDAQEHYSFLENVMQGDFLDDVDGFGECLDFELEKDN